jgi:deoxyribodipyrimidine photo-lyase
MAAQRIEPERIARLNDAAPRAGRYILYWMQQSQRTIHNPALEYAIQRANALDLPVLVGFGLTDDYPDANARHYSFMLEGLADVGAALEARGIGIAVQRGRPDEVAVRLGAEAALVVCDRGYARRQKAWRARVAEALTCAVIQVEGDVVVPVETASDKAEYAARTIRPKINRLKDRFLKPLRAGRVKRASAGLDVETIDISTPGAREQVLRSMELDWSVPPAPEFFTGGQTAAQRAFKAFLRTRFGRYAQHRNQPQTDDVSHLSMHLHFGQISPVQAALDVIKAPAGSDEDREVMLEELIVRRELAQNFIHFTADYDHYACLPQWAKLTLRKHKSDQREHVYTARELEEARTHDPYWNAAMREMRLTGFMHNYMRMYWGKKILEWSNTPEHAYRTMLALNNTYFIDGRDGNSYAGVGWCFGLHDRPWTERSIFGTVRYMNANGLKRKCDPDAYVEKVEHLSGAI